MSLSHWPLVEAGAWTALLGWSEWGAGAGAGGGRGLVWWWCSFLVKWLARNRRWGGVFGSWVFATLLVLE